jgi:glycosyltransferase involved in cell wall biosynthesis
MSCRILYVVGQLGSGGLERQLYLLLRTLDRDQYQPEVVVWNFRADDTYVQPIRALNVPIHSFAGHHSKAAKLRTLRGLVLELKPEVLHSYSFYTNFPAWSTTLGTKTIALGAVRSDFIRDRRGSGFLSGNLCARWPRAQIYNNFASAKKARRASSVFAPKEVFVVRNGLDLGRFQWTPLPMNGRARVLGVGSLLPDKRWDRLLTAALTLKNRGYEFLVDIAGDGPLRESLEKQAQDIGVLDYVKFRGYTDHVPALLSMSCFLAHTSDFEGCPNVVMEAMACGRPVVAMAAGDVPSLVEDGKTGFVVARGDEARLIDRLAILINDRDLCRKMGEAGRIKAEREFSLERLVNQTLMAYRSAGWQG